MTTPGRTALRDAFPTTALVRLLVAVVAGALLASVYLAASEDVTARDLPIAVTGPESLTTSFVEAAGRGTGDTFDIRVVATAQELPDLIREREVYGGVILTPESWQILYAGANGQAVNELVTTIQPGRDSGISVTVDDVVPASAGRPQLVVTYVLLGVVLAAVLHGAFAARDARGGRFTVTLLPAVALAVVLGLLVSLLVVLAYDAVPGSVLVLTWYLALLALVAGVLTTALGRLLGVVGVALAVVVLLGLSLATAGTEVPAEHLSGALAWMTAALPVGSAATGVVGHAWFAGAGGGAAGATLVLWAVVAVGLLALATRGTGRAPAAGPGPDDATTDAATTDDDEDTNA